MDLIALDRKALDINLALIKTIEEDQCGLRTPCDKWNVGELLQHLTDSTWSFAGLKNEGGYPQAADAAIETFSADGYLDKPVDFGTFGEMPGRWKVASHLVDTVVHTWDLQKALNLQVNLDEELAAAALKIVERMPNTPATRGPDAAFHDAVPIADTATLTDRLIALSGRSPAWA